MKNQTGQRKGRSARSTFVRAIYRYFLGSLMVWCAKVCLPWCSNRDTFFLLWVLCIPVRICAIPFQNWLDSCGYQLWERSRSLLGFWGPEQQENIQHSFLFSLSLSLSPSTDLIGSSWPAAKVFHFFNNVVTSFFSENWEPVYIWTRLGDIQQDTIAKKQCQLQGIYTVDVSKKI